MSIHVACACLTSRSNCFRRHTPCTLSSSSNTLFLSSTPGPPQTCRMNEPHGELNNCMGAVAMRVCHPTGSTVRLRRSSWKHCCSHGHESRKGEQTCSTGSTVTTAQRRRRVRVWHCTECGGAYASLPLAAVFVCIAECVLPVAAVCRVPACLARASTRKAAVATIRRHGRRGCPRSSRASAPARM